MISIEQAQTLIPDIAKLTDDQFAWIEQLVISMAQPCNSTRSPTSDVFPDERASGLFFLYIVTHHAVSFESFKKEKFEYAVERLLESLGRSVVRPS